MSSHLPDRQQDSPLAMLMACGQRGALPLPSELRKEPNPLWRLMFGDIPPAPPREDYEKGYLDGLRVQCFKPGDLNGASYAFAYLNGYARKNKCDVNWNAVLESTEYNPLIRALAGDTSPLIESVLSGAFLSAPERDFIAKVLAGKWKRPPHAVKTVAKLVRNFIIGHLVLATAHAQGRERREKHFKPYDPE